MEGHTEGTDKEEATAQDSDARSQSIVTKPENVKSSASVEIRSSKQTEDQSETPQKQEGQEQPAPESKATTTGTTSENSAPPAQVDANPSPSAMTPAP